MQTFVGKHNSAFNYNKDLSGEVIITNQLDESSVKIKMSDLCEFQAFILKEVLSQYKKPYMPSCDNW